MTLSWQGFGGKAIFAAKSTREFTCPKGQLDEWPHVLAIVGLGEITIWEQHAKDPYCSYLCLQLRDGSRGSGSNQVQALSSLPERHCY